MSAPLVPSEVSFHEAGVDLALDEQIMRENVQAGGDRGLDRLDNKLPQSPFHRNDGVGPRCSVYDDLGDHRIVAW